MRERITLRFLIDNPEGGHTRRREEIVNLFRTALDTGLEERLRRTLLDALVDKVESTCNDCDEFVDDCECGTDCEDCGHYANIHADGRCTVEGCDCVEED
jgi:hypothetical protein